MVNPQFNHVKPEPSIDARPDFVESDYYDTSEFIRLFFERESGNTFDGITASTTLAELSEHPTFGADMNARDINVADYRQALTITRDISIGSISFRFDNTHIYTSVPTYNSWGYHSGYRRDFNFDATLDAVMYNISLSGKAYDKRSVVFNALKSEIERRQGQTMINVENDYYYLLQSNGKLSYLVGLNGREIAFWVAFSEEYLANYRN